MSLNNISLPSQLLANLYQHVLIQDTARAVPVKAELPFLGKNGKGILIVVRKDDAPYLPDHELHFLTNVLSACQLGLMDVAIVNWARLPEKKAAFLFEQLDSKEVILFDVEPEAFALPADFQPYVIGEKDGRRFVLAPSLSEIEKNKEAKEQLWMALKQFFGL